MRFTKTEEGAPVQLNIQNEKLKHKTSTLNSSTSFKIKANCMEQRWLQYRFHTHNPKSTCLRVFARASCRRWDPISTAKAYLKRFYFCCMSKPEALEHFRLKQSMKLVNNQDAPHLLFLQLFRKLSSSFLSKKGAWKRGRHFLLCSSLLRAHQVTPTLQTPRIRLKLDANVSFLALCI